MATHLSKRERSPRARSRFFCHQKHRGRGSGCGVPRWFPSLLALLCLSACIQKTDTKGVHSAAAVGPPYIELSAHPRVGVIKWIHPERHTVIFELAPHINPPPSGGRLISRDSAFVPRAVLEVIGDPDGRFLAARVLGGKVATGQSVVAPGPELQKWGEELLQRNP